MLILHLAWTGSTGLLFTWIKIVNYVDRVPSPEEVCGKFEIGALGSPISLIVEEGYDVDENAVISNFQINPYKQGKKYSWKASSKSPLLVHDPKATRVVSSAEQLFGDWTFGGKKYASLLGTGEEAKTSKWENGYEALATLDIDDSGAIEGRELDDLALWFDDNRNGVSEKGEVRSLDEAGITRIFYTSDYTNKETGSVVANRGFEKLVDGKTVVGKSVDWYGEEIDSVSSMLGARILQKSDFLNNLEKQEEVRQKAEVKSSIHGALPKEFESLTGAWEWKMKEPEKVGEEAKAVSGILVFGKKSEDTYAGQSVFEVELSSKQESSIKSQVNIVPLVNFRMNEGRIKFETDSENKREVIRNTVHIVSKNRIEGKSRIRSATGWISYNWVADLIE